MTDQSQARRPMRVAAAAVIASLSLLLTGCFIMPGKFTSSLELGEDQNFAFSYEGEIFFAAFADPGIGAEEEFTPEPCYVDGTDEVRECSTNELEGQRAEWDANAQAREAEAVQKAEQAKAMLGGIDPSDPEAIEEFKRLLLRQKGWSRVEDKGNGTFDVSYRIEGKLTHDFMFPVIEGVPTTSPFVQVLLREGEVVRVNAPGYSAQSENNPMMAMMGGMGALAGLAALAPDSEDGNSEMPPFPMIEGTFTLTAAPGMSILANNTDEGPSDTGAGQKLEWKIDPTTKAAPTALFKM